MYLNEFMSYKTFYYFLKDDSNLDLQFHKDKTEDYKEFIEGGYKTEDFYRIFDDVKVGTKDIVMLKTKYGTLLFHIIDKHDYIKDFLKANSIKKPCALFGSHRVSDTYQIGIAENGELLRYIYYADEEHILEGTPTKYEIENNVEFKLNEDGFFDRFLNEDDVYNYAQDFLDFDFEQDIEILDFKYYRYAPFADEVEVSDEVSKDIISQIHNNLKRQGYKDITFYFTKYEDDDMCDCSAILRDGEDYYYLFSKNIKTIKDKKLFEKVFNKCLNTLATQTFKEFTRPTLAHFLHTRCMKEFKHNICMGLIENESPGELSLSLTTFNSVRLSNDAITKHMITFPKYVPKHFKKLYTVVRKMLR